MKTGSRDQTNDSEASNECPAGGGSEHRAEGWLQENYVALESSTSYVESHGIPLAEFRRF